MAKQIKQATSHYNPPAKKMGRAKKKRNKRDDSKPYIGQGR